MSKTVLFDVDSIFYTSCYDVETFDDACHKFDETIQSIVNTLEEENDIDSVKFIGLCRRNYRYKVDSKYKANRADREKPEFIDELRQYMHKNYEIHSTQGVETDDLVVRYHEQLGHENTIICSVDKDYLQCEGTIYNYWKKEYYVISKQKAMYNFWCQMITGDSGDNVNYLPGKGKVFARKLIPENASKFTMMKRVYELFVQQYKSKARERFIQQYLLLKLNVL